MKLLKEEGGYLSKKQHYFRLKLKKVRCLMTLTMTILLLFSCISDMPVNSAGSDIQKIEMNMDSEHPDSAETAEETEETSENLKKDMKPDPVRSVLKSAETNSMLKQTALDLTEFPGAAVQVSSWQEFTAAIQNDSVSVIELQQDLKRSASDTGTENDPGIITRNLAIIGNGNTIDFGTLSVPHIVLGDVSGVTKILADNVTLIKTSGQSVFYQASAANTINWNIHLNNVKTGTGITQYGLVNAARASVLVSGTENEWFVGADNTYHLYIGNFELDDGAELTAHTKVGMSSASTYPIIRIGDGNSVNGSVILGEDSKLTLVNNGSSSGDDAVQSSNGIGGYIVTALFRKGAQLNTNTYNYGFITAGTRTPPIFEMASNSSFTGETQDGGVFRMGNTANDAPSSGYYCTMNIGDEEGGARMDLLSHAAASSASRRYTTNCLSVCGNNSVLNLNNGSIVNAVNDTDTVFVVRGEDNVFNVKDGSELNLESNGTTRSTCATLRFYISGHQTFNIIGGEVNIVKRADSIADPGLRMYGNSNAVNVSEGGKLYIYNEGDGTANGGSSNSGNQGLYYTNGSNNYPASFTLNDPGSSVEITADFGPAIYSSNSLDVEAGEGTVFILEGNTDTYSNGALNVDGGRLEFDMDSPLYYDFRNNCTTYAGSSSRRSGAPAISGGNSSSYFISKRSDLAVWQRGSRNTFVDMDGTPTATWSMFDYQTSGSTLQNIVSTNIPGFDSNTYLGTEQYSRMNANNASAVIDELRVPTNADKYIYGHAYVPEGLDEVRDAWTNEVYVTVQVRDTGGNIVFKDEGITQGVDDEHSQGISVYGEEYRGGIFEILYDPNRDGQGAYLPAGYTVEVVSAYRSSEASIEEVGDGRVHHSSAEDLQAEPVTVRDVTPPKALALSDVDGISSHQLSVQTKGLNGTSKEVGKTIYLYKNGTLWMNSGAPVTAAIGVDQKWSITFPGPLQEDDVVALALNDGVPNAADLTASDLLILTENGVFANDGNENPYDNLAFHNAHFGKRLEFTAVWTELCPYVLDVSDNCLVNAKGETAADGIIMHTQDIISFQPNVLTACDSDHVHELIVIGQSPNKTVYLPEASEVPYNVRVNGIQVKQLSVSCSGTLVFGADDSYAESSFQNTTDSALIIGDHVTAVSIESDAGVTAYANKDAIPVAMRSRRVKLLDLILYQAPDSSSILQISGKDRTLPEGAQRIAVLDNLDGTWLNGEIEVVEKDSGQHYVRGTSARDTAGQWDSDEDSDYSDRNHYGKIFALDQAGGTKGLYQAVRLPSAEKHLSVSVPVRLRFGMKLDGDAGHRGSTSWEAIPKNITNNSYSYEDCMAAEGKRFELSANQADICYNGIKISEQERAANNYRLKSYSMVKEDADQIADKPMIALRGSTTAAAGIDVELDEDDDSPQEWFTMPPGTITPGSGKVCASVEEMYLSRPESEEGSVNDYYQYPADRTESITAVHRIRLLMKFVE